MYKETFVLSCAGSLLLVLASVLYAADTPAEATVNRMPEVVANPPADVAATPAPREASNPSADAVVNRRQRRRSVHRLKQRPIHSLKLRQSNQPIQG